MSTTANKPLNVQAAKIKLNEFFIHWLTMPETQDNIAKMEKAEGVLSKARPEMGSEILLGMEGLALDGPMIQLDRVTSGDLGSSGHSQIHTLSFNSPPRSPRASPSGVGRPAHAQPLGSGSSPMVDELDIAHRQGAMSPHGSPRATRSHALDHMAPTSPLQGAAAAPAPSTAASTPTTGTDSSNPLRLSAAFAQMGDHLDASGHHSTSPHLGPTSPSLRPLDREVSGGSAGLSASGTHKRPKKQLSGEPLQNIPVFYYKHGKPIPKEETEKQVALSRKMFEGRKAAAGGKMQQRGAGRRSSFDSKDVSKGLNVKAFMEVTSKVCLLPKWTNELLFRRVYCYSPTSANHDKEREKSLPIHPTNTLITQAKFKEFFDHELAGKSKERRLFDQLKWDKKRDSVTKADLRPMVEEVLLVHPGLEFLKTTPDFQERYSDTVQIRIMYAAAMQNDKCISWPDFLASSLCDVLHVLDAETDINVSNKTEYFSYEHFYVLYCKFWELDGDHDFLISKDDLAKYGNYSLTSEIVDRIFSGKGRPLTSEVSDKMSYEDFVWFCLCEEDKATPRSLEYWFRCTDLDGDGILAGYELDWFFKEQKARMEASYQETIAYEDILCQMMDMIAPARKDGLRLNDIKSCKLSGNFFNALFNLTKFIAFEQRDPFMAHAEKQQPEKTDWDRFAKIEYDRMSHEAGEQEDVSEDYNIGGAYDGG